MLCKQALFGALLLLSSAVMGQQNDAIIDSLQTLADTTNNPQINIDARIEMGRQYRFEKTDKAIRIARSCIRSAKNIDYQKGLGKAYELLALCHIRKDDFRAATESYDSAFVAFETSGDTVLWARCLNTGAIPSRSLGEFGKAIQLVQKSINLYQSIEMYSGAAAAYNGLGIIYYKQGDTLKTFEYFDKALQTYRDIGDTVLAAKIGNNIGILYKNRGDTETALNYFIDAAELWEAMGDSSAMAVTQNNIGSLFQKQKNYGEALKYYTRAYEIWQGLGDNSRLVESELAFASLYHQRKDYTKALKHSNTALEMAEELNLATNIKNGYYQRYEINKKTGRLADALSDMESYTRIKDSLDALTNSKEMAEMREKFDADQKAFDNKLLRAEKELTQVDLDRQRAENARKDTRFYFAMGGLALLLLLGVVLYRSNRQKKAANEQLETKNAIIEEKNKDILDSIRYAKRIQSSILPPDNRLANFFPSSFIFYKPRDIVSGDFYWIEEVDNQVWFAVADCTGHGVPGAMVSVVGANGLNRCVKEYGLREPAAILDQLSKLVEESFSTSNTEGDGPGVRDGMDISLCCWDPANKTLRFAGANSTIYHLQKQAAAFNLTEIKGDKQPVGPYPDRQPFSSHELTLADGDGIYLFSDGYADQFGGPKGKKFKYKPFKDMLLSLMGKAPEVQRNTLEQRLHNWQGNLEQVDDICVIGIRV